MTALSLVSSSARAASTYHCVYGEIRSRKLKIEQPHVNRIIARFPPSAGILLVGELAAHPWGRTGGAITTINPRIRVVLKCLGGFLKYKFSQLVDASHISVQKLRKITALAFHLSHPSALARVSFSDFGQFCAQ